MYFKQFYLGCLAQASYLIGSQGVCAVVDPQRDVDLYIQEATSLGFQIKYVIETHLHADFVSGHSELASRTGAQIVFGSKANALFPHIPANDGDEFHVGDVTLRILETPGHTPESISILVEQEGITAKVLTGDTLFIGDVGRPDLVGSKGFTAEQMAGMLYDSLHSKLLTLSDDVEVWPAHGAGSLCGRNMGKETSSTIGHQRLFNYALRPMEKADFVAMMTTDLPEVPAYFPKDAELNRAGASDLGKIPPPRALSPAELIGLRDQGAVILDVRPAVAFGNAHVAGSLNVWLGGQFASWSGILIPVGTPILVIAEDSEEVSEAVLRLARVGMETVTGYLEGGMYEWDRAGYPVEQIKQMPVDELRLLLNEEADLQIIDVRRPAEFGAGHVPGARNYPLASLARDLQNIDRRIPAAVICQSGYRSSAGASVLARAGFDALYNIVGGTAAWSSAGFPAEVQAVETVNF